LANHDQVLISDSTFQAVKDRVKIKPFGLTQLKGKLEQVMIYEVTSTSPFDESIGN
jgi:class 3 adenylate cyclase